MSRAARAAFALAGLLAAVSCGGGDRPGPQAPAPARSDRGVITLTSVVARSAPAAGAAAVATLSRGTEVQLTAAEKGFWRVAARGAPPGWVPTGSFERVEDRAAREARAKATASFAPQPGRAVEACPVLLAPDYGAARWSELEDGDEVAVVLPDNDFFGIRLADGSLAFVPARSIRLLPAPTPEPESRPPQRTSSGSPPAPAVAAPPPPREPLRPASEPEPAVSEGPYEALPPGAEPPVLTSRVEARFPDSARLARATGEVQLRIVIEPNGEVGSVDVIRAAPYGMTAAAIDAVKRWRYAPARIDGRPVAVVNRVTVRFSLSGPPRE